MKEAYYFPHDANARTDARILELRAELGWEGYGLWWALVEHLREASEYKLSNVLISGLAMDLNITKPDLRKLLDLCIAVGLLVVEGDHFHSPSLRRRMAALDAKRQARADSARNAAEKRWQSAGNANALPPHSEGIAKAMRNDATVENSREQDNTEEDSKDVGQPASLAASSEIEKKGIQKEEKEIAFESSSIYLTKDFFAFLDSIGYPNVEKAMYLLRIQAKAQDEKPRTDKRWKAFVQKWLDNDKKSGDLLNKEPKPGERQPTNLMRPKDMQVYR
jgi:hypothetical protein